MKIKMDMEGIDLRRMRDVLIEEVYKKMYKVKNIFFLSADFGAPPLDKLRKRFRERFINVGIAEQNLINISTGLALEGFTVFAYGISAFLTMRAYEQIRNNLALFSQFKNINVNLIGVGAGLSYDVSGPTHHCLEDISLMRLLPNIMVFSPSDWVLVKEFVDFSLNIKKPKYIRLDGMPLPQIYKRSSMIDFNKGFFELKEGDKICLVSTGYMTQIALKVARILSNERVSVGVIDIFSLKNLNENLLAKCLKKYKIIISVEEAFINKGGLDSIISNIIWNNGFSNIIFKRLGFREKYIFGGGSRSYLHKLNGLDKESIINVIRKLN